MQLLTSTFLPSIVGVLEGEWERFILFCPSCSSPTAAQWPGSHAIQRTLLFKFNLPFASNNSSDPSLAISSMLVFAIYLFVLTLKVRIRVIIVSAVKSQCTATFCCCLNNDSVSNSKSTVSNHSNFAPPIQQVFQLQLRGASD